MFMLFMSIPKVRKGHGWIVDMHLKKFCPQFNFFSLVLPPQEKAGGSTVDDDLLTTSEIHGRSHDWLDRQPTTELQEA